MRFFKFLARVSLVIYVPLLLAQIVILMAGHDIGGKVLRFGLIGFIPTGMALLGMSSIALYERLRPADIVITVADKPTPLMLEFQRQDQRLLRREQLKQQILSLNAEIETFNAELSPDGRKAWLNRPGPYGK